MKFRKNPEKIIEAILWLCNEKPDLELYFVGKMLFLADKWHLAKYGRPVTGDEYFAAPYGPIPSTALDLMNRKFLGAIGVDAETLPFSVAEDGNLVVCNRAPNTRKLSKSDIAALRHALDEYGHLDFATLKKLTHGHPAYKEAWAARGDQKRAPMSYEAILRGDGADEDWIEELQEISEHVAI